jgi:ribosomal protein L37AE/L43A
MTDEELRARLLAEAEKAINDLLAEKPADNKMTLTDIERLVGRMGQQVQANVLKELGRVSHEAHGVEAPVCERCGSRMQRRGRRPRQVVTEVGEMTLERAYYVCPGCGASLFPPG